MLNMLPVSELDRGMLTKDTARVVRGQQATEAQSGALLDISPEAQGIAQFAQIVREDTEAARLRAERLAEIRERLEQGTYRVQEVVRLVAERIAPLIP